MIPFLPRQISLKAVGIYFVSLALVTVVFMSHALSYEYMILGAIEVLAFFCFSTQTSMQWQGMKEKNFVSRLFWVAFAIRLAWVVFSYFFYKSKTGIPFEFSAADSLAYHSEAAWLASSKWSTMAYYLFRSRVGYSDSGYMFYLYCLYSIIGPNIILTRVVKALLSACTCLLVYRLAKRNFDEPVARMAGIFCMLMPNLIVYCGLHLKETEMLFLVVAFLERTDYLLREKRYNVFTIAVPVLLGLSLFFFRTVLGVVAFLAFFTALLFTSTRIVGKAKRFMLIAWGLVAVASLAGGTIINEVEGVWNDRDQNQEQKRMAQTMKGNQWAKYATGTVMMPMMFVVPFATMVDVDGQYNQQVIHGGNYVRNFMGVFVLVGMFVAFFKKKTWRNFSLIIAFAVGYLAVIGLSGFANSERFVLPALPCLLIISAYGVSEMNARNYRFVNAWPFVVLLMEFAWAFFKMGSRGFSL